MNVVARRQQLDRDPVLLHTQHTAAEEIVEETVEDGGAHQCKRLPATETAKELSLPPIYEGELRVTLKVAAGIVGCFDASMLG